MSALAKFLLAGGYEVAGSDMTAGEQTEELALCGVKIFIGGDAGNPLLRDADAVVYTSAVSEENAELKEARARGKKIWKIFRGGCLYNKRKRTADASANVL